MMGLVLAAPAIFVGWLVTLRRVVRQRDAELQEELDRRGEPNPPCVPANTNTGCWSTTWRRVSGTSTRTRAPPSPIRPWLPCSGTTPKRWPAGLFDFMDAAASSLAYPLFRGTKDGVTERHDFEFLPQDGSRIYTSIETGPLFDERARFTGAIAGVQDVTALRATTEACATRKQICTRSSKAPTTSSPCAIAPAKWSCQTGSFARLYHALSMSTWHQRRKQHISSMPERNRWNEILAEVHTGDAYHMDYAREIDDRMRYFAMSIHPVRPAARSSARPDSRARLRIA